MTRNRVALSLKYDENGQITSAKKMGWFRTMIFELQLWAEDRRKEKTNEGI